MIKNNKGTILVVAVTAMIVMIIIGFVCLQMYMNQSILDTYDVTKKRLFYSAEGIVEILRGYINITVPDSLNDVTTPPPAAMGSWGGFLYAKTLNSTAIWNIRTDSAAGDSKLAGLKQLLDPNIFDGTMHPGIKITELYVKRIKDTSDTDIANLITTGCLYNPPDGSNRLPHFRDGRHNRNATDPAAIYRSYEIVVKAEATHNTALIGGSASNNIMSLKLHYYFFTEFDGSDPAIIRHRPRFVGWRIEN